MITFERLWETMQTKEISQYRLIKYYGFSSGQIGRLKKNMYVSTHTIDILCEILECNVEDIMQFHSVTPETVDTAEISVDYLEQYQEKIK